MKKRADKMKKMMILTTLVLASAMLLSVIPVISESDAAGPMNNDTWTSNSDYYDVRWYVGHETENKYVISDAKDFAGLAALVNGLVDGKDAFSFSNKIIVFADDLYELDLSAHYWTPIGKFDGFENVTFRGEIYANIDGGSSSIDKNVIIKGIYVNGGSNVGLFGSLDGIVSGIGLEDSEITGTENVGGIAGYSSGTIKQCYSTAIIKGSNGVGGIAGDATESAISECFNFGTVEGTNLVGGIVGTISSGDISDCYNTGVVKFSGSDNSGRLGGIVGNSEDVDARISDCFNAGKIPNGTNSHPIVNGYDPSTMTHNYWLVEELSHNIPQGKTLELMTGEDALSTMPFYGAELWDEKANEGNKTYFPQLLALSENDNDKVCATSLKSVTLGENSGGGGDDDMTLIIIGAVVIAIVAIVAVYFLVIRK